MLFILLLLFLKIR